MKTPQDNSPSPRPDPEDLLRARIRDTSPEFEARFDVLRRRLANEPRPSAWREWFVRPFSRGALVFASAAALVIALFLFRPGADVAAGHTQDYSELVALDDTLRDAMALIDSETLDILLQMPLDSET
jgi:hypothetical protein